MRRARVARTRLALCAASVAALSAVLVAVADPAAAPTPAVAAAPQPVVASRPVESASIPVTLARSEPTGIVVPALDLDAGLIGLGLRPDGTMEVPPDAGTVGWFTGAPTPGEQGPAVIAAHVNWAGRAGAFADLGSMRPRDEIRIVRADGGTVVFVVDRVARYPKDRFPTEEVYGDIDHAGLRLITCGGAFDERTRSYLDNVVVFASMRG